MKVIPVRDMVIIEPSKEKKSSIIIPDTVIDEHIERIGKVIKLGEGIRLKNGKLIPFSVAVGDIVIFKYFQPRDLEISKNRFFICKEEDILLVIK